MYNNYYDPFGNLNNDDFDKNFQQKRENRLKLYNLQYKQKKEIKSAGFSLGFGIILSLVMQTIMTMVLKTLGATNLYLEDSIFFSAFNSLAISVMSIAVPFGIIAAFNKRHYITPLVPTRKIGFVKTFIWTHFGLMACILMNLFVGWIIIIAENLGYKLNSPDSPKLDSVFACIMLVISTTIMPAICEEFAMRCCAMGLLRKHGKSFAVFAVSIIFGLLHGNVIQFIFAFLVGIVLAYVTMKTQSILPAILIHGLNNGRSVIYDIVEYASNTETADSVISGVTIYIMIAGILCALILAFTKNFKMEKDNNPQDVLPFGQKLLALLPGLALPLILLIATTITSIEKM